LPATFLCLAGCLIRARDSNGTPVEGFFLRPLKFRTGMQVIGGKARGRPRHRWVDNTRMDLGEVGWDGVDWIGLTQDRDQYRALVNAVMNLWVP
jgi:hypothetical protein